MAFKVNPDFVEQIIDHKIEGGSEYYRIVWKEPEQWIKKEELDECHHLIRNHGTEISQVNDEMDGLVLNDDSDKFKALHDDVFKKVEDRFPWYSKEDVKKAIRHFHDDKCKNPADQIKEAKEEHKIMILQLEVELKKIGCKKLEFTGSSYEGLKITSDGLEFDVMFIMDGKDFSLKPIPDKGGYYNLIVQSNASVYAKYLKKNIVLPNKVRDEFYGFVQKFVNDKYENKIKLLSHGPAVQINVFKEKSTDIWYSVDLVPCYEVTFKGKKIRVVPKPMKESSEETSLSNAWRRSFSEQEKQILKNLDQGNKCRRQVCRIIKGIRHKEATFQKLNSYHLKTILFHLVERETSRDQNLCWDYAYVTDRVFDVLAILEGYLSKGQLPNYFVPSMNLIDNIKPETLKNITDRISAIRRSEIKFLKMLKD